MTGSKKFVDKVKQKQKTKNVKEKKKKKLTPWFLRYNLIVEYK